MSAIAGILNFDHSEVSKEKIQTINKVSAAFRTDRTDEIGRPGVYFSCAHQYFTKEAEIDVSPIINEEEDIIFNADIFLFNRKNLIDRLLSESKSDLQSLKEKGDAELAYLSYLKYGIDFIDTLNGAFAIAIYDKKLSKVFLITDYVAYRHLVYSVVGNELYYSSTLHVVSALMGDKLELDEEWIGAAYMDFAPDTEKLHGHSVYKNIIHVEPAHYIEISLDEESESGVGVKTIEYWNPKKNTKPLKLRSDEEYGKLFRETFVQSVNGMLRARKKHGVLLSGGLDSSAVVSVAANELSKSGEKIYSFTQIPSPDYKCEDSDMTIENETETVLKNKLKYPNIECSFVQSNDLTSYSEPEKYIRLYAQPVKPILNAPYLYAMNEEIKRNEISIVLTGASGNQTVSYGTLTTYIFQKNRGFHFISSLREASAFCRRYHINRPRLLKYYISRRMKRLKGYKLDTFINDEIQNRYNLKKVYKERWRNIGAFEFDSYKKWKNIIFDTLVKQHLSYFYTCQSLFTGTIFLDPTMRKEIIELCMAMPIDCFVRNGKERRAIRDYLKGIVSDDILDNVARGIQAADYLYRTNKYWDQTKNILFENLSVKELDAFFDRKKVDKLIEDLKSKEYNMDKETIATASVASVLGCFLKNYKRFCKEEKWTVQGK